MTSPTSAHSGTSSHRSACTASQRMDGENFLSNNKRKLQAGLSPHTENFTWENNQETYYFIESGGSFNKQDHISESCSSTVTVAVFTLLVFALGYVIYRHVFAVTPLAPLLLLPVFILHVVVLFLVPQYNRRYYLEASDEKGTDLPLVKCSDEKDTPSRLVHCSLRCGEERSGSDKREGDGRNLSETGRALPDKPIIGRHHKSSGSNLKKVVTFDV
mmetsp:Transcript_13322/g.48487  ORF Transcript_13322/g.48487 Transcript_13322/m.48487 type:complete len:216 (+) Transcript_13322:201-848(+)|eukprot:scaffold7226_cov387-Prasinococcus_capsulatus_cf.AAC.3